MSEVDATNVLNRMRRAAMRLKGRKRKSYEVDEEEFRRIMEARVRYYFSMSLDDFKAKMEANDLPPKAAADDLVFLLGTQPG
jgi:hypothetical protein